MALFWFDAKARTKALNIYRLCCRRNTRTWFLIRQVLLFDNNKYTGCLKKNETFRNYPIVIISMPEHYAKPTGA